MWYDRHCRRGVGFLADVNDFSFQRDYMSIPYDEYEWLKRSKRKCWIRIAKNIAREAVDCHMKMIWFWTECALSFERQSLFFPWKEKWRGVQRPPPMYWHVSVHTTKPQHDKNVIFVQVSRRWACQSVKFHVADCDNFSERRLWRYRTKYLLWSWHCSLYGHHGELHWFDFVQPSKVEAHRHFFAEWSISSEIRFVFSVLINFLRTFSPNLNFYFSVIFLLTLRIINLVT